MIYSKAYCLNYNLQFLIATSRTYIQETYKVYLAACKATKIIVLIILGDLVICILIVDWQQIKSQQE